MSRGESGPWVAFGTLPYIALVASEWPQYRPGLKALARCRVSFPTPTLAVPRGKGLYFRLDSGPFSSFMAILPNLARTHHLAPTFPFLVCR